jgi:hypothetical protein
MNTPESFLPLLALLILLYSAPCLAVVHDDFDDGNFTDTPAWSGDCDAFNVITDPELPEGAADTDGAFLASLGTADDCLLITPSTEVSDWTFSLGTPDIAPSDINHFGVVLMASDAIAGDLMTNVFQGYYLRVGNNGTPDKIQLWRSTGIGKVHVGTFDTPDFSDGGLRDGIGIRVTRSGDGAWALWTGDGFQGGGISNYCGALTQSTYTASSYFGVYTHVGAPDSSRRIYLDNISIGGGLASEPSANPLSGVSFGNPTSTSLDLNLAAAAGDGSSTLVICASNAYPNAAPIDGMAYSGNADFTLAPSLGSGRVIYSGPATATAFTVSNLCAGVSYYLEIFNFNGSGGSENYRQSEPGTKSSVTRPPVPTMVTASDDIAAGIDIAWSAATGATKYKLYRGTTSSPDEAQAIEGFADGLSYTDTLVEQGKQVYYFVKAVAGNTYSEGFSSAAAGIRPCSPSLFLFK